MVPWAGYLGSSMQLRLQSKAIEAVSVIYHAALFIAVIFIGSYIIVRLHSQRGLLNHVERRQIEGPCLAPTN